MAFVRSVACGRLAAVAVVLCSTSSASGVVVQVTGQIVPDNADNIASALTRGELAGRVDATCSTQFPIGTAACWSQTGAVPNGAGAGPEGPIDSVLEARTDPEVFDVPSTTVGSTTTYG